MVELKGECMCVECGNEANLIIRCEPPGLQESLERGERKSVVCDNCGNEASMTMREHRA